MVDSETKIGDSLCISCLIGTDNHEDYPYKKKRMEKMENTKKIVAAAASRLAALGSWPAYIDAEESLTSRVPDSEGTAPGFDAGIACALDLIPREKQYLSAILHAAYTEAAVEQVRREIELDDEAFAESESCWWLAACSVCDEGGIDAEAFDAQIAQFKALAEDLAARVAAARVMYAKMSQLFGLIDGVPVAKADGGMQGAYIAGYDWAVQPSPQFGLFFVGTFRESLGLEEFEWLDRKDDQGRPMSGPVHGSRQFVKASSFDELARVVELVKRKLG